MNGWKDILAFVSKESGLSFSVESIRKMARRKHDPLPVTRWGRRVTADAVKLKRWVLQQGR